jgi:hypothetical protein
VAGEGALDTVPRAESSSLCSGIGVAWSREGGKICGDGVLVQEAAARGEGRR